MTAAIIHPIMNLTITDPSQDPARQARKAETQRVISTVIMWVVWVSAGILAILSAQYLTGEKGNLNAFSRPFDVYATGMFLIPVFICGGLRFWLSWIRNPALALLPYFVGVFFAWTTGFFGIFLLPDFCIVYQLLSVLELVGSAGIGQRTVPMICNYRAFS